MTTKVESLIRHFLTALGMILVVLGLNKYTGIVTYITENLSSVLAAGASIAGFITTLFGFFKNSNRFSE